MSLPEEVIFRTVILQKALFDEGRRMSICVAWCTAGCLALHFSGQVGPAQHLPCRDA